MVSGHTGSIHSGHPSVFAGDDVGSLPDEELIERFLNHDGEDAEVAFRAVVARHGPMVLGVCRHILQQQQDAEDAFQATFLILARKACSIHDRRVLARWLYEVAYRVAVRAKANAVRRRTHERQGSEMAVTTSEFEAGWSELRPVLHEEVNRLPDKYRTPVVLCYLEGKTNEEVARILKWPVGTVKGRLFRARELLRSRLIRRGLTLSAAFLLTTLSRDAVFAEIVPDRLITTTARLAMTAAKKKAGATAISPEVSKLMDSLPRRSFAPLPALAVGLFCLASGVTFGAVIVSTFSPGTLPALSSYLLPSGPTSLGGCHDAGPSK